MKWMLVAGMVLEMSCFAQTRQRLPEPLNLSNYIEYAPSVSADGRTLIFQSDRYGLFVNAARKVPVISSEGKQQKIVNDGQVSFFGVYETHLHPSGEWTRPEPIMSINAYGEGMTPVIGGPSISYDGNELYFFANYNQTEGSFGREDLYYCVREKKGWGKPINLGPEINTAGYEGFPSISPDGRQLYFVRENLSRLADGNQKCYRIMRSEKGSDGRWKRPIELSPPINMDCEKAPRIMADGRTLVYSSLKTQGKGDFDLYLSKFQDEGTWSTPTPLEAINTKRSDQSVAISACGDVLYYISDGDIYTYKIPAELRPFKMATIQGFVTDSLTGNPIRGRVVVTDLQTQKTISTIEANPSDGRFTVLAPTTGRYELSVNQKSYRLKSATIPEDEYRECRVITRNFRLTPLLSASTRSDISIRTTPVAPPATSEVALTQPVQTAPEEKPTTVLITPAVQRTESVSKATVLRIKAQDLSTNEVIPARITVVRADQTIESQDVTNGIFEKSFVSPESILISVTSPGYNALNKTLAIRILPEGETVEFVAGLEKIKQYLSLSAIDLETGKSIPTAQYQVIDRATQSQIPVKATNGTAEISLPAKGEYEVSGTAAGYNPHTVKVDASQERNQVVFKLSAVQKALREVLVNVTDFYTGESLAPTVVVKNAKMASRAPILLLIAEKDTAELNLAAYGYAPYTRKIFSKSVEPETIDIRLRKSDYAFEFRAVSEADRRLLTNAKFSVQAADTKEKIPVQVTDGVAQVVLPLTRTFVVSSTAANHTATQLSFNPLTAATEKRFQRELSLKPIAATPAPPIQATVATQTFGVLERGKAVRLNNIFFDQGSPVLRSESNTELDKLAEILIQNPAMRMELRGHTDNAGDFDANVKLSRERCIAVVNYLVSKGIERNRLQFMGRGPIDPVVPNTTEENRKKNRRVEFVVL